MNASLEVLCVGKLICGDAQVFFVRVKREEAVADLVIGPETFDILNVLLGVPLCDD
ncbi:hypothetical protein [Bacillus sp. 2205SS5-2]|uniref:hypothetical protein n=1 Tax=Bacillus sp. 2205SS5-2 TaxID=3109031 RepID=UPI003005CFD1